MVSTLSKSWANMDLKQNHSGGEGGNPPLVVILGPTAVGKSQLALQLALEFGGEIVSADSRQIYRGMDIGTAKPTPQERAEAPHHLLGIVDPDQPFTLAQYLAAANQAIAEIQARHRVPFLVGGTGLYIRAVLEGFQVPAVAPHPQIREKLAASADAATLYSRLQAVDPAAAAKIDPKNVRRIVRALEVYEKTGRPISTLQTKAPPPYRVLKIGLTMERPLLYRRIDERVNKMMAAGLLDEVQGLLQKGYSSQLPAMSGLGYKELVGYSQGELGLEEAVQRIKLNTHRFVREQYKWFRLSDPSIHWFDVGQGEVYPQIRGLVAEFFGGSLVL